MSENVKKIGSLSESESAIYIRNLNRREDMLNVVFKDGTPDNPRSVRLALDIMRDNDDSLLRMVKVKQDESTNESDDKFKIKMLDLIRERKSNSDAMTHNKRDNLPDDLIDGMVINNGELGMEKEILELSDFIKE